MADVSLELINLIKGVLAMPPERRAEALNGLMQEAVRSMRMDRALRRHFGIAEPGTDSARLPEGIYGRIR